VTTPTVIEHLDRLATMDADGRELSDAYVVIEDGAILSIGQGDPGDVARDAVVVDGRELVALPGLVNTHHHFFQTLTRGLPAAQDAPLLVWESTNYPYWARLDEEAVFATAQVALAELLLSGCTTSSDQLYAFPKHTAGAVAMLGAEIEAARSLGIRVQPTRGAVDIGPDAGGSRAKEFIEDTDAILASMDEAISRYHDPAPGSMVRIGLGPNGVTVCTETLMRGCVELAERRDVTLHTHVAEIPDEGRTTAEQWRMRPIERLAEYGWIGDRTWLAHAVHLDDADLAMLAAAGTAVAHCPSSNMRLASGAAPVHDMLEAGVIVGLGVDGSASNDTGNLLAEARQALLLSRLRESGALMSARTALRMATAGGAQALRRDDVGVIEPGRQADLALYRLPPIAGAGFESDPIAALVLSATPRAEHVLVGGRFVVRDGHLVNADEETIAARHRQAVARLVSDEQRITSTSSVDSRS
jgi:cytosine/adenosine deaminase-related metal-dependent hydrolase